MPRMTIVPLEPGEAQRVINAHFESWLAAVRASDVAPGCPPPTPLAQLADELAAMYELHAADGFPRSQYGNRLGPWKYAPVPLNPQPTNVADPSAVDPAASGLPEIYFSVVGTAGNGDLYLATRDGKGSRTNEVWIWNHELDQITEPIADSIASFCYMAALDARLEGDPPAFEEDETDEALQALAVSDPDAYDERLEELEEAFKAAWEAELNRAFSVLDGRVYFHWTFSGSKSSAPVGFRPYRSSSPVAQALGKVGI
jgi:hypothetical protein